MNKKHVHDLVAPIGIRKQACNTSFRFQYIMVADTNKNAVKLYEKLGFVEIKRVKMNNSKRSCINFLVYMRYVK